MDRRKPKTVKVTVYSCRNLKPKKGDGDPLAWVVFGFGKDKCCTSQIRDRNAKWNEESVFTITDPKIPLKINVKDKDDLLGQIVIPVNDIPTDEHFLKWVPIGAHKKTATPFGELCIDCWVEDYYDNATYLEPVSEKQTIPMKYFNKTIGRLTNKSPEQSRNNKPIIEISKHSPESETRKFSVGVTSMKGSVSVEDLSHKNKNSLLKFNKDKDKSSNIGLLLPQGYNKNMKRASSSLVLNTPTIFENDDVKRASYGEMNSLPTIKEQNYPPKIQNIVPTSGSTSGGTLIQITGKHLGTSKDDITRLMVAGCNCISTVEYYSPNKIICTTSRSFGKGPISLSTKTGGMSSSKMMFEFIDAKIEDELNEGKEGATIRGGGRDYGNLVRNSDVGRNKDEVIEQLRNDIDHLKTDNRQLREYIDKLVVYLMDKYPDALESSKMYYR